MTRRVLRRYGPIVLGGAIGYAYYAVVGCATGSCPITAHPWTAAGFGMLAGAAIGWRPDGDDNEKEKDSA